MKDAFGTVILVRDQIAFAQTVGRSAVRQFLGVVTHVGDKAIKVDREMPSGKVEEYTLKQMARVVVLGVSSS